MTTFALTDVGRVVIVSGIPLAVLAFFTWLAGMWAITPRGRRRVRWEREQDRKTAAWADREAEKYDRERRRFDG